MTPVPLPFLTPENALIFRITHIRNVPWILDHGLHCPNATVRDPNFVEIGIRDLIAQRAQQVVPIPPGGVLSDYIPFYFTPRSVMLLKIVWPILQASDFRRGDDDPGRHERYQAEALAYQHIPVTALDRFVCYGAQQEARLAEGIARRGLPLGLEVHPDWFFG